MATSPTPPAKLKDFLESLDKRVYNLQQLVTSPSVMGGQSSEFDNIVLDPDGTNGGPITIDTIPPSVPDGISSEVSYHYNNVIVDISWSPSSNGKAASYAVELGRVLTADPLSMDSWQEVRTLGTAARFENLSPNTNYAFRITALSSINILSDPTDWQTFTTGHDVTLPAQVEGLVLGRGATSAVVKFTPNMVDPDVMNGAGLYEVQIDTANTFSTGNLRISRSSATVVAFNDVVSENTWYARVRAIDSSGNAGPWSTTVSDTLGGVIDSMVVAGLDAAKITFGSMSGDRITVNSMDVSVLKTSVLTTADIFLNGGSIQVGTPPTTGILFNSQGLRAYKDGNTIFSIDAVTGAATFTGSLTGSTLTWDRGSIGVNTGMTLVIDEQLYSVVGSSIFTSPLNSGNIAFKINTTSLGTITSGGLRMIALDFGNGTHGGYCDVVAPTWGSSSNTMWSRLFSTDGVGMLTQQTSILARSSTGIAMIAQTPGGTKTTISMDGNVSVNGNFFATGGTKSFFIDMPGKPQGEAALRHDSLEGPETGVYYRGQAVLSNGQAEVVLPDYYKDLVCDDDATILVTVVHDGKTHNVSVSDVKDGKFSVYDSVPSTKFHWAVLAARGKFEPVVNGESAEWLRAVEEQRQADFYKASLV